MAQEERGGRTKATRSDGEVSGLPGIRELRAEERIKAMIETHPMLSFKVESVSVEFGSSRVDR